MKDTNSLNGAARPIPSTNQAIPALAQALVSVHGPAESLRLARLMLKMIGSLQTSNGAPLPEDLDRLRRAAEAGGAAADAVMSQRVVPVATGGVVVP